ncbi:MAG: HAD family phosphatase [Oscillospiraceae bacterium]|jgi:HAD superfamily hydrolase (TIGR01509 family)|nr:HAD family phosphatase [Oscillospiraceae bacterium]
MIFFDLDGTLIDSNGVWLQVDHAFLGRRGLEITPEYTYTVGHSIFPVAAQFTRDYYRLEDSREEIMAEWRSLAYDAYAHTIPLKPGARELLDKLAAEGRDMALLTASLPELAKAAVTRHDLEPYFQGLFFAQDVGLEKKNPQVYRIAAERFRVSPAACILVEDAPHNCAAAKAAGFQVVGVYDDFYKDSWDKVVANSHRAVRSLSELIDLP